ncbi:unnamed protein product, partial [Ectocarpus sp. 12 AP-2014]
MSSARPSCCSSPARSRRIPRVGRGEVPVEARRRSASVFFIFPSKSSSEVQLVQQQQVTQPTHTSREREEDKTETETAVEEGIMAWKRARVSSQMTFPTAQTTQ